MGLSRLLRCISILLFSSAGMISSARIYLWLALFFHRDDFFLPDSSLAYSFLPQGLFLPSGFISGLLFFTAGIISFSRMHPWLALLFRRDDFFLPDSSLACSFLPQGLFLSLGCIPGLLFCSAGIISSPRMHPWLALLFCRDYFFPPNSSLNDRFCMQGCILPTKFIPDELFHRTEIITCLIAEKNQKTLYFQRLQPFSLKVQGS